METGGQSVLTTLLTNLILKPHKLFATSLATQAKGLIMEIRVQILFQMDLCGWDMLNVRDMKKN